MRQGYRQRVAAVASAAVLGGVPLLLSVATPAHAATERTREVVFAGGGLGVVSCGSRPSVSSLTVPAESTVRFVNKLNQGATLRLDGRDAARVPRGGVRPVLFHRGPVRVEMVPDCLANVGSKHSAATVEVTRAPTPGTPGGGTNPPGGGSSATGGASGPASGGGSAPGQPVPGRGAATNPDGTPAGGPSAAPGAPASPGAAPAPPDGGGSPGDGATVDESASPQGWAAEPVAAAEPVGDTGPVGLLALIATVCVVGVSVGTIRAIITKRATRTSWA